MDKQQLYWDYYDAEDMKRFIERQGTFSLVLWPYFAIKSAMAWRRYVKAKEVA